MKNNVLDNLEVYQLAKKLSNTSWTIYESLSWQDKKTIGDQFITSIDSVGANIAEGYGRYHYLDKIKFMYNARGSFYEAIYHWLDLLLERKLVHQDNYQKILDIANYFIPKLNAYINSIYNAKQNNK